MLSTPRVAPHGKSRARTGARSALASRLLGSAVLYGMYLSAAGALVEEARQSVIANNIANSATDGFKSDAAVFRRRLTQARESLKSQPRVDPVLEGLSGGVFLDEVAFSRSPGPLTPTGNPLDLALRGDGFFAVSDGQRTLYTRAGSFRRSESGELVTADGRFKVLGADGRPIVLGPGEVTVNPAGEIKVAGQSAGKLLVAGSLDPSRFEKVGGTYFRYLGQGNPSPVQSEVAQGFREGSDVSPVSEMVKLIQSHRAYEANLQMARLQDASLGRATNELGRITA
jgi:flagellar basal-body rod protein FlgF